MKLMVKWHLSKRERSRRSEKQLAERAKGRVQPASGALPVLRFKGDVITDKLLFDDKTTQAESFSVKLATYEKLKKEAWFNGERMAVVRVRFEQEDKALYVIDENLFHILMEAL